VLRARAPAEGAVELAARDRGTPLFWIHPIGGGILSYVPLARHLGRSRPVWAVPSPGLDGGRPPLRRVEALAAAHLEALRTVRPHGPYLLGGWSFGGLVAWEMRRRLRDVGEEVPLLTLVDSWPAGIELPGNGAESPLAAFTRDLAGGRPIDLGGMAVGNGDAADGETLDGHLDRLLTVARSSGLLPPGAGGERVRRLWQAFTAHAEAAAAWRPQPPGGRTLLLLAAGEPGGTARGAAIAAAWAARGAAPLEVRSLDATHWTLLAEPRVREAAERIDECLDEMQIP
jgi:thioesterase domain-containing protein